MAAVPDASPKDNQVNTPNRNKCCILLPSHANK